MAFKFNPPKNAISALVFCLHTIKKPSFCEGLVLSCLWGLQLLQVAPLVADCLALYDSVGNRDWPGAHYASSVFVVARVLGGLRFHVVTCLLGTILIHCILPPQNVKREKQYSIIFDIMSMFVFCCVIHLDGYCMVFRFLG